LADTLFSLQEFLDEKIPKHRTFLNLYKKNSRCTPITRRGRTRYKGISRGDLDVKTTLDRNFLQFAWIFWGKKSKNIPLNFAVHIKKSQNTTLKKFLGTPLTR